MRTNEEGRPAGAALTDENGSFNQVKTGNGKTGQQQRKERVRNYTFTQFYQAKLDHLPVFSNRKETITDTAADSVDLPVNPLIPELSPATAK